MSHQVPKLTTVEIIATLKQKGVKLTLTRKELIEVLLQFDKPFTAEEVLQHAQREGSLIHRATIYRDLHLFVEHGVLVELAFQGATAQFYELPSDTHHHHFVCQGCSEISDVIPTSVEKALKTYQQELTAKGWRVTSHHLKFYGLCQKCAGQHEKSYA